MCTQAHGKDQGSYEHGNGSCGTGVWKEAWLKGADFEVSPQAAGLDNDYDYGEWYELTRPKEEELAAQRETRFAKEPLLSIVIPAYKTPEKYLREMLDSILAQTYKNGRSA